MSERPPGFFAYLVDEALLTPEEVTALTVPAAPKSGLLGRMLLRERVVNVHQMARVLRALPSSNRRIGDLIVDFGFATRAQVERVAAKQAPNRQQDAFDLLLNSGLLEEDTLHEAMLDYIREIEPAMTST